MLASPLSVVTTIDPSEPALSASMPFAGNPSRVVNAFTVPPLQRASPSLVPIHSDPSASASRQRMSFPGSAGLVVLSKTVKAMPSKRASPASVPSHKKPSRVCASACTEFCGSPLSIDHDCRAYRPSGVFGSSAADGPAPAQNVPAAAAHGSIRRQNGNRSTSPRYSLLTRPSATERLTATIFEFDAPPLRGMDRQKQPARFS
jgi:hypothetical protein